MFDLTIGADFSRLTFNPLYEQILSNKDIASIRYHLDLACGTGTFACQFSKVTNAKSLGIDLSGNQLTVAQLKAKQLRADVTFLKADVLDTEYPSGMDVVTMTFDALNHLRQVAAWQCLFHKVRSALRPGGLFLFDVNTPARLMHDWEHPEVIVKDTATYIQVALDPQLEGDVIRRQILMKVLSNKDQCFLEHNALIEQIALSKDRLLEMLRCSGFTSACEILQDHLLHSQHMFLRRREFFLAVR